MAATRTINSGGSGAGTSTLQAAVTLIRDGNPSTFDLPNLYFSQSSVQVRTVDFSAGNNTLLLHADTRCVILIPKAGNSAAWIVRVSGDTGHAENLLGWTVVTLTTTVASLEVNAGGTMTDVTVIEL